MQTDCLPACLLAWGIKSTLMTIFSVLTPIRREGEGGWVRAQSVFKPFTKWFFLLCAFLMMGIDVDFPPLALLM
jgi:hypothetical protein